MYKFERYRQLGLADFNQPVGLKMNQENRWIKEQEYYNSVEEKLNASDDKALREFANIKELAKEMEEKRTEADSIAFNGVHAKANEILSSSGDLANKLNMVSEALEGFEQRTVSAIAESSASVSQEVKDGVIQSTSHMNDVSERVIEIIQKNDKDTAEKLDHQSQEILFAISGSNTKAQKNYDSLVGVLSEVKLLLNEVENEISNAEKGNAQLTEELKKSIAFELQNVGDELSKIEGTQKDNAVQIIELVDSKLLELNQELVKQANSILDKSDENTDYVSEKYNRVFDQIQSVAKESKILINRVNDAIEENKNTIIQSQNAIIKIIGGSVIAIAGIGIESLLNKIGIGEPWSIVLSTMLSGIASAMFMYLLDKVDIFSVKAEKRRDRIIEIFDERIKEIEEAADACNIVALETLRKQREEFEDISGCIDQGLDEDNITSINQGLYEMAKFMNVDLEYSDTEEFCDYMDSNTVISL